MKDNQWQYRGIDDGESIDFKGIRTLVKATSDQTHDSYSVVEQEIPPGMLFAPHVHANEDQFAYVLTGELWFRIGDDEVLVGAGCSIFRPRGIPHATWNASPSPARMLEITSPGRFDDYLREVSRITFSSGISGVNEVARAWGIQSIDDWTEDIRRRFGLSD